MRLADLGPDPVFVTSSCSLAFLSYFPHLGSGLQVILCRTARRVKCTLEIINPRRRIEHMLRVSVVTGGRDGDSVVKSTCCSSEDLGSGPSTPMATNGFL